MGRGIRIFFWLATFWMLAYDLLLWGGLALTPVIGKQIREQASVQSPIAATYLFVGRQLVQAVGEEDRAAAFAARAMPALVGDAEGSKQTVLIRALAAQKAVGRLAYYGFPLLLVLSLVLHTRRQKQIRSFGTKG